MADRSYALDRADNGRRDRPLVELLLLAAAMALLQAGVAGYTVGVGNQTLQIPFLLHLIDPQLFAGDPAIAGTIARYPSWCYHLLAPLCALVGWPLAYAALHLLSGWALHAALLVGAARWLGSAGPGLAAGLLLLAGHQHGVAGGDTYVQGFTHTWLALPWALWALIAAWDRRWLAAGLLLGLLFDLHALMAGYATALALGGALAERRRGDLRILGLTAAVAIVAASPTLWQLATQRGAVDERWLALMRVRSGHHSFPLELWTAGEDAIPRLALLLGLAAAAVGLLPEAALRRRAGGVLLAFLVLVVLGVAATGSTTVLKAQLWRSSALVVPLALVVVGHAPAAAWREGDRPARALALGLGAALVVWAHPGLAGLQWPLLALVTVLALAARVVAWPAALVLGAAHAVALAAAILIEHPLVAPPRLALPAASGVLALAAAALLVAILARRAWPAIDHRPGLQRLVLAAALLVVGAIHVAAQRDGDDDDWTALQHWTRDHTPVDARILTPLHRPGFRIHSQRAVVAEWRDGTQLYFAPAFADTWWRRLELVQPGIALDTEAGALTSAGLRYAALDDEAIHELCRRLEADWVVLPAQRETRLVHAVSVGAWQLCRAELTPLPPPEDEGGDAALQRFMTDVVEPNIRRHRTGTIALELRDPAGGALKDLAWELEQVDHAFGFGCSLGHFVEPAARREKGFKAPVVQPEQLELFAPVFNHSTIPYSAKWVYLEPEPERRFYDDLDAYIDWCTAHDVTPEYHFVTGYAPDWVEDRPKDEQRERLLAHARDVIARYGERIPYWQVVNEKKYLRESPAVFALFRELLPQARLGISDCARFYSDKPAGSKRERDLLRGLDEVRWLREQGVELDFFALHAHRPFGLWADLTQVYPVLDAFAAEGLRLHISEFGIHDDHEITGEHRHGRWDRELQAEYYELMFRVLYSHPAVDVINLWGFTGHTWMTGSGFLDAAGKPKPAYHRIARLIGQEWTTRATGTLPLTGAVATTGFHGDYQLRLVLADGRETVVPFSHPAGDTALRIVLDPANPAGARVEVLPAAR